MPRIYRLALACALLFHGRVDAEPTLPALPAVVPALPAPEVLARPKINHVLIISEDGLRLDAVEKLHLKWHEVLRKHGTWASHALTIREKQGVWGGATERERRRIIRQRRRTA